VSATAAFSPPLTVASGRFRYTLRGSLSDCHAGNASGRADGAPAGTIFTAEPAAGQGGCTDSSAQGTAVIEWSDGNTTVVPFATVADGAGLHFTGYVAYSHTTYTTNEPSTPINDSVEGGLALAPNGGPAACRTGVRTAMLTGLLGFGSPF
jgi:hypothetical protein